MSDIDKAIEILRVKGISKASKKMSRDAKEGVIAVSGDENKIDDKNKTVAQIDREKLEKKFLKKKEVKLN